MNLQFSPRSLRGKTDNELTALVRTGDEQAMAVLAARFLDDVKYHADCLADVTAENDDLVQEGMIGLMSAARSYSPDKNASFRTYANTCIRNQMISALRSGKKKHDTVSLDDEKEIRDPAKTPEEHFDDEEYLAAFKALTQERLSQLENDVLKLYLEGNSYDQISESLNVSPKSVDNALQRIRKKLRPNE